MSRSKQISIRTPAEIPISNRAFKTVQPPASFAPDLGVIKPNLLKKPAPVPRVEPEKKSKPLPIISKSKKITKKVVKNIIKKLPKQAQVRDKPEIPKSIFQRIVRRIAMDINKNMSFRFQKSALEALQFIAEDYMIKFFERANLMALHANRLTVQVKDIALAKRFRSDETQQNKDFEPI